MKKSLKLPWLYVPTLYFAEGLPYVLINVVSVLFYDDMGLDNATITLYTSWLYLPWVIKMFWSPLVDTYSQKRNWIIGVQFLLFIGLTLLAFCFQIPQKELFLPLSIIVLFITAFLSATQDIAIDGYYMLALNNEEQTYYVGVRPTFYRLAMLFGQGMLVFLAGKLAKLFNSNSQGWFITLLIPAVIFLILTFTHQTILPQIEQKDQEIQEKPQNRKISLIFQETISNFSTIFSSYFTQKNIIPTLAFILCYRFGEAMLGKLSPLFLKDTLAKGGLGLTTDEYGLIVGTIGLGATLVGGIIGGIFIAKVSFNKSVWLMAIAVNVPNLFYFYMANFHPSKLLAYPLIALDQFGSGFGLTAFTVYLIYVSQGLYKTSHFAISTGIMALGMMIPGAISGTLQERLGYSQFFLVVCLLAIPSFLTLLFIDLRNVELGENKPFSENN